MNVTNGSLNFGPLPHCFLQKNHHAHAHTPESIDGENSGSIGHWYVGQCPSVPSAALTWCGGGWPARGGGVETGFTSSSFPSPLYLMLFSSVSPLPASRQDL